MSVLDWQMDIEQRLVTGLPNTPVFIEGVPEGSEPPLDATGLIKPLIMLWFGQLTAVTTLTSQTSLGGFDPDDAPVRESSFIAVSAAPNGRSLLQLENAVRRLLTGFCPDDQGELQEDGSSTIRDPYPTGIGDTLRIYKPLYFSGVLTVGAAAF